MPRESDSSPAQAPPLWLDRIMTVIAALASPSRSFRFFLAGMLAVTVVSILVVPGLRLPLITDGRGVRRWLPWTLWSLALVTCPIATAVVGTVYEHTGPPALGGPRPWAAEVVDVLFVAHLGVSVVGSVAVVVMTRSGYRWLAWVAILAIAMFGALIRLGATMATTGVYL
jgi:hypothetical protein